MAAAAGGEAKMAAGSGSGALRRVRAVLGHLAGQPPAAVRAAPCGSWPGGASCPEDVVVVHGRRTAIGRAKRGGFKVGICFIYLFIYFGVSLTP